MKVDHLFFPFVPNEHYEGAMILFDIVIDESWYALVKLLSHADGIAYVGRKRKVGVKKKIKGKLDLDLITTWLHRMT
jgi:hypothetical protein